MIKLVEPEATQAIIKKYKFRLKKSLGQNFLINRGIIDEIVKAADLDQDQLVIEIGPGIGTLTQFLAEQAGQVITIELDRNLLPILKETLGAYPNVQVVQGDALKTNLDQLVEQYGKMGKGYKVVANLPYYITTPIIMRLLEEKFALHSIVVMVQKEVAQRMVAKPGKKDYGALSVAVQFYTLPEIVTYVPRGSFNPPPAVESAVIKLVLHENPPIEVSSNELFFRVVKGAFGQRRKTLLNALSNGGLGLNKDQLLQILTSCDIDPTRRGETLSLQDFANIANLIAGNSPQ